MIPTYLTTSTITLLRCLFVCCLISLSACSINKPEGPQVSPFKKNEIIVFIGDSITHGGSYHKNIFLYYSTRFPHHEFKYYNAGISGDTAVGTLERFETDIAIHKPTTATIMLGMNDVSLDLYKDRPTDKVAIEKRNNVITTTKNRYIEHMEKLIVSLKKINTNVILIKPSIYDQTAKLVQENKFGANDQLIIYGNEVSRLAKKYKLPVIDFQTPMLSMNEKLQAINPAATIVGKDRVHPGEEGHLVMAHAFLKSQNMPALVSGYSINMKSRSHDLKNCQLEGNVTISVESIDFSCTSSALPFPLNEEQKRVLKFLSFQQDFNQQILAISGLNKGQYKVTINNQLVGEYSNNMLSDGINLAGNINTPMYQQALKVKYLNDKRAELTSKLRGIALVRYSMLSKYPKVEVTNKHQVKETLFAHVEKSLGKPWYNYLKSQVYEYLKNVEQKETIENEIDILFDKIKEENKPQLEYWRIQKTG